MDLIDRQTAIDAITDENIKMFSDSVYDDNSKRCKRAVQRILVSLPSAEPERKTGRWIPVTNGRGGHKCNCCHEYAPSWATGKERLSDFCPSCGQKMEVEQTPGEADKNTAYGGLMSAT